MSRLVALLRRARPAWLGPRRPIWPTRDGWWYLFVALGLGVAAVNTGNNLVYLLCSLLLALIVVSGILSEQSMRGLRLTPVLPEVTHAERPALVGAIVTNRKRRLASHSITLEAPGAGGVQLLHIPYLDPGGERLVTWPLVFPARGRHRVPGLRMTTRFPFGLFVKSEAVDLDAEVIVYPALRPVMPDRRHERGSPGPTSLRRRGRGDDLYNLRDYRAGDDPRLIHWRSSAKAQTLTVRELEDDTAHDVRLRLVGDGRGDGPRLERGISEAASLALYFLRRGAGVELRGPGLSVALGRGHAQEGRILTALALYQPATAEGAPPAAPASRPMREIPVALG
jgi:uncharacterized protein (DUF58 family)